MYPIIFHLYGPFALHSFSVALAVGVAVFIWLTLRHPLRKQHIPKEMFLSLIVECAIAGIFGGRLLHLIGDWHYYTSYIEMVSIWNGGLSIFGTIIGVIGYGIWFLYRYNLPIFPIADLAALYAPLIHMIARIGCFLAGCCYGKQTTVPWAILVKQIDSPEAGWVWVHPTQIYSSLIFFGIFLVVRFWVARRCSKQGQLAMVYLIGASLERFFVDFLRGDRIISSTDFFSFHQWIALALTGAALATLIILSKMSNPTKHFHESV